MKKLVFLLCVITFLSCKPAKRSEKVLADTVPTVALTRAADAMEAENGIIFFSANNGLSWQNKSNGLPAQISIGLGAIAVSKSLLGILTTEQGVYLYDFINDRWKAIPTDQQIIANIPRPMIFFQGAIYAGTEKGGVFMSGNQGKSWSKINAGLQNLTIRRFIEINHRLYAGTNAGFYAYNELQNFWTLEYGNGNMQVNGITDFNGAIYIGTNQGVFVKSTVDGSWKQVLTNRSVHNISSDGQSVYAMAYNELLSSVDGGRTWQNIQKGLPAELYTFNVIKNGNAVFAGQWDGVYRRDKKYEIWKSCSNGLPAKFAFANLKTMGGILIVSGSERGLKSGMTTNK